MRANEKFLKQDQSFWANVRTISELLGYTQKAKRKPNQSNIIATIKVPTFEEVKSAFQQIGLDPVRIIGLEGDPSDFGQLLFDYFEYRADALSNYARPHLMEVKKAKALFHDLKNQYNPSCPLPMNKQKGEKKDFAFFTGIINMIIEKNSAGYPCNHDPRKLTAIVRNDAPLRTLSRRVDGAFTSTVNPIAIWEIKEYYYTTTFGSRVADGIYETLLDGMELEELHEHEGEKVKHYLMLDDYNTWWNMGRSYLCRIIDMLHMGYVDEVFFGDEVIDRLPILVQEWVEIVRNNPEKYKYQDNAMVVAEPEANTETLAIQQTLI